MNDCVLVNNLLELMGDELIQLGEKKHKCTADVQFSTWFDVVRSDLDPRYGPSYVRAVQELTPGQAPLDTIGCVWC